MLFVILAAGQGKRMNSDLPKVLQPLVGKPVISHLLDTLQEFDGRKVIIFGHKGEQLQAALSHYDLQWIEQKELLGTGHATAHAMPLMNETEKVVVLFGDTPLISSATLQRLLKSEADLTILSGIAENPFGYGRIVRNDDSAVIGIVEEKDATPIQLLNKEINTGILTANGALFKELLPQIRNTNAQNEYYLTDIVALAAKKYRVEAVVSNNVVETLGINDRAQLAHAENILRQQRAKNLLEAGTTLVDPHRIDIQGELIVGRDVVIEPNVIFKGRNIIGNRVRIEAYSVIIDSEIGDDSEILSHCRLENVQISQKAHIGPFARLRPKTVIAEGVKIGNFVEIKSATIDKYSKINHLSYIGDATIGECVNVGAGTITCNYDGANKHQTIIDNCAFIGSNTALVAPVKVGKNATIGAGSTIRKDVHADSLTFTVNDTKEKTNWERPKKS